MEIRFAGSGDNRVVGTLTPTGTTAPDPADRGVATAAPLIDTGIQYPGEQVTVVLADPGTLVLSARTAPDRTTDIAVTPRTAGDG